MSQQRKLHRLVSLVFAIVVAVSISSASVVRALPLQNRDLVGQESEPNPEKALAMTAAAITASSSHTCALTTEGAVWCWGYNEFGMLGTGTTINSLTPVAVMGLSSPIKAIAAGVVHTCALTAAGAVWCWGDNRYGQLGDGTITQRLAPVSVSGLTSGVVAIATGNLHTCALTNAGAVRCWGANYRGQLGDGTINQHLTSVAVSGLASGVVAIATQGGDHTCALTNAGAVRCWGANDHGQVGDGTTTDRLVPTSANGLTGGVSAVATGWNHTCALMGGGTVRCWGYNAFGQVGDGEKTVRLTPVPVSGLTSGVMAIAGGGNHSCAIINNGTVQCWGYNAYGQVGDGTTNENLTPVTASQFVGSATVIATGGTHTCAIKGSGAIWCWGGNDHGELGDGTKTARLAPVGVNGVFGGAASIATGRVHTCVLSVTGAMQCWGENDSGQLGDSTTTDRYAPTNVTGLPNGVTSMSAGGDHTCALTNAGVAWCWGSNVYGQIGDGTLAQRLAPAAVSGLANGVTAIAAGGNHSCALIGTGAVRCWGDNYYGQIGDGTLTQRLAPTAVSGLASGVTAIAAGYGHTCALTSVGAVLCWGRNDNGQLGDGTTIQRAAPAAVSGLASGVVAIAAGGNHSCALLSGGLARCWGDNFGGQLGDGTYSDHLTPAPVSGLTNNLAALAAGGLHTCVLANVGAVQCWGYAGRSGDGSENSSRLTPVAVSGLSSGVVAIAAGGLHSCALISGGTVQCWGFNSRGQVGVNPGWTPVNVTGFGETIAPSFEITHIETTQAIQDIVDSVPLVAGKPTFARVYVDCRLNCVGLSGSLHGYGPVGELPGSPLRPVTGYISAGAGSWQSQRSDLSRTLNFNVPTEWTTGVVTLTAQMGDQQLSTTKAFMARRPVKVVYMPVTVNGQSPDPDRIDRASWWMRRVYPTHQVIYLEGAPIQWTQAWDDAASGKLKAALTTSYRLLSGYQVFGWVPNGYLQGGTSDPTWHGGAGVAAIGDDDATEGPRILAHEIAHLLGRRHANTAANVTDPINCVLQDGTPDEYRAYVDSRSDWPFETSLIDQWGLDAFGLGWLISSSSALKSPDRVYDFMSYCGRLDQTNVWTSSWTYSRLFDALTPTAATSLESIQAPSTTYAVVSGYVNRSGTAALEPAWTVTTTEPPLNPPGGTAYCLEAQSAALVVMGTHCFDLPFGDVVDSTDSDSRWFSVVLPVADNLARVSLKAGGTILAERLASVNAPVTQITTPGSGDAWGSSGMYSVVWSATDSDGDALVHQVQYSPDGITWLPLGLPTSANSLPVDASQIPGSAQARIRILTTDGMNTRLSESQIFVVGSKAPSVHVAAPLDSTTVAVGVSVLLDGYANDAEDGALESTSLRWQSDRDGLLGVGESLLVNLTQGRHTVTLTATDSSGSEASESIVLNVGSQVYLPMIRK